MIGLALPAFVDGIYKSLLSYLHAPVMESNYDDS